MGVLNDVKIERNVASVVCHYL